MLGLPRIGDCLEPNVSGPDLENVLVTTMGISFLIFAAVVFYIQRKSENQEREPKAKK